MKTTVNVADVVRIGGCQTGLVDGVALKLSFGFLENEPVEFDRIIEICTETNNRFLRKYFLDNKARLLEYTDAQLSHYQVHDKKFDTLEEAIAAADLIRSEKVAFHKALTRVIFSESVGEDATWVPIDIDTFMVPEGVVAYHFHVFNHKTGLHEEAATQEQALALRDSLAAKFTEQDKAYWQIVKWSVYAEDGVSTTHEVVE